MKLSVTCVSAAFLGLAACAEEPAAVATPAPKVQASFQEVMLSVVDPAADGIWNAVRVSYDSEGEHRTVPTTDEEWLALRRHAVALIEAPNLIAMEGRPLLHPGAAIEFAEYYPAPAEIQARIDADRPAYLQMAQALQASGMAALAAIDKKDVPALEQAGERIDVACEACHQTFWYKKE